MEWMITHGQNIIGYDVDRGDIGKYNIAGT